MSCENKSLKVWRGYATKFASNNWLEVDFDTEITITGWSARVELCGVSKEYENIEDGFSVNFDATETATMPVGLQNGSIILIDLEGNDHPFSTDIPVLVSDWVEGDIELSGFSYTVKIDIQENELTINMSGATPEATWEQKIIDRIDAHNSSQSAHPYIQGLITAETTARTTADTTLQSNITAEATARASADTTLQTNITNEATARSNADGVLQGNLNTEISNRQSADTTLQTNITNEATTRANADNSLSTAIDVETSDRQIADSALGDRIDNLQLNSLTDVNTSSPTNGQALVYDTTTQKWKNGTVALNQGTGISISNNTISVADPTLINYGTGSKGVAVGKESEATQEGTTAVGYDANATSTFGTAVGYASRASNTNTVAVGKQAKATQARATAIGALAEATAQDAIQVGGGTNSTASSLQVKSYKLLDLSTGIIPNERLDTIPYSKLSGVASLSQGALADTALQPNDLSATSPITYSNKNIGLESGYAIPTSTQIGQIATNTSDIATINGKIPTQAGTDNQLADKNFVNSSINSVTAYYITRTAQGDQFNTKAQLDETTVFYSGGVVREPTRNDYCIVLADETKTDPITGENPTTRYIYQNGWEYQYTVNKTTLTAAQLAAVNSGITASLVADIGTALQPNDNVSELTNDAGYITGITSSDVTTALGYTPYNATNPNGYQTASQVSTSISAYHDSTKVDANNAITGGTYTKITYDSKGLVTGGADLSASDIPNLSISKITDITASASEINVLDGITATTAELNYCDGVTSNIQTQLNGKANEDDLGTLAYADAITNGDISGTINQDKITNLTTDLAGKQPLLPDQTSQSGKFLTTNGTNLSWGTVDALPSQSGQSGKFLKTNGTTASWAEASGLPSQTGHSGSVLTTNGTTASWVGTSECAVVIESKRPTTADQTWYRVYSDGWVEQGGRHQSTNSNPQTITLLKEMADTNYFIGGSCAYTGTGSTSLFINTNNKLTTSFQWYGGNTSTVLYWEVKGYKA